MIQSHDRKEFCVDVMWFSFHFINAEFVRLSLITVAIQTVPRLSNEKNVVNIIIDPSDRIISIKNVLFYICSVRRFV